MSGAVSSNEGGQAHDEESEKKAAKKRRKIAEQLAHERYLQELHALSKEKVMSYEEAFAKIEEATGIKDVDKLVDTFIAGEDKNFKMYTFVNGQSDDIENLEN